MFGSPMTLVKVSPPDWKGWEGAAWQLGTKIPNFGLHVVLSTINHPKTSPNSMAEGFLGLDGSDLRFHQVKPGSISIHFPHWSAPTTRPCFSLPWACHVQNKPAGDLPICHGRFHLDSRLHCERHLHTCSADLNFSRIDISRTNLSRINISGSSSCHHQWPGFHREKRRLTV